MKLLIITSVTRRAVTATKLNRYFAAHRCFNPLKSGLTVTHILTGYSAAHVPDMATARRVAKALLSAYGGKWRFKNPEKARAFKDANQIIEAAIKGRR